MRAKCQAEWNPNAHNSIQLPHICSLQIYKLQSCLDAEVKISTVCTGWLEERLESVYKKDPKYSDKASSLFMLDLGPPEKLPDALRGEKWSFVQLPLSALQSELELVEQVTFASWSNTSFSSSPG